uniref:Uncharacterized protein n=1 Tax=Anguilla anguilla TaxID=7936 RepID=A0A0E9QTW6_ANGAN
MKSINMCNVVYFIRIHMAARCYHPLFTSCLFLPCPTLASTQARACWDTLLGF